MNELAARIVAEATGQAEKTDAPFVTTSKEWGERTAMESGTDWVTRSGYGRYVEEPAPLHRQPLTRAAQQPTATPGGLV